MKPELKKLHQVWEQETKAIQKTNLPSQFDEIIGSIFTLGPSYHYVIDFLDMTISHMSASIQEIHGLQPETVTFNDILDLIHPDDVHFVIKAEETAYGILKNQLGERSKILSYKSGYCIRFKVADGSYRLFFHQGLQLTLDEHGGIAKALNIHTDISHITSVNNYKLSIISLSGEPSYTDIDVLAPLPEKPTVFTKRETEILKLVAEGFNSRQIADKLCIALDTVKNHRRNILDKADASTTAQLIKDCMLKGLL